MVAACIKSYLQSFTFLISKQTFDYDDIFVKGQADASYMITYK